MDNHESNVCDEIRIFSLRTYHIQWQFKDIFNLDTYVTDMQAQA